MQHICNGMCMGCHKIRMYIVCNTYAKSVLLLRGAEVCQGMATYAIDMQNHLQINIFVHTFCIREHTLCLKSTP